MSSRASGKTFFCFHPIGGSVMPYLGLANALRDDCDFYGIEARGLHNETPDNSITQAAAAYLEGIVGVQPSGTYHLGGWSLGGGIAFEVARRLHNDKAAVAPVVMIDTDPGWLEEVPDAASSIAWFVADLCRSRGAEPPEEFQPQASRYKAFESPEDAARTLAQLGVIQESISAHIVQRLYAFIAMANAFGSYEPHMGEIDLLLFSTPSNADMQLKTWSALTNGEVRQFVIDECDHYTMLTKPHVDVISQHVITRVLTNG